MSGIMLPRAGNVQILNQDYPPPVQRYAFALAFAICIGEEEACYTSLIFLAVY
jgi:hypothetical protein